MLHGLIVQISGSQTISELHFQMMDSFIEGKELLQPI